MNSSIRYHEMMQKAQDDCIRHMWVEIALISAFPALILFGYLFA